MTTTEIRKMAGLENDEEWPRKLRVTFDTLRYRLAELQQAETYFKSIGYVITSLIRNPEGQSSFVMVRNPEADDADSLLRECRRMIRQSFAPEDISQFDESWDDVRKLIDRLNRYLGDEG